MCDKTVKWVISHIPWVPFGEPTLIADSKWGQYISQQPIPGEKVEEDNVSIGRCKTEEIVWIYDGRE